MALDAIINAESHAKLNPAVQPEYLKQADGTFILTVNPYETTIEHEGKKKNVRVALEDVGGLKTTLATLRSENDNHVTRTKAFEGLDAAAARKALADVEKMKDWSDDEKVRRQIAAQVEQVDKKYKGELEPLQARNGALLEQLDEELGKNKATACLKSAGATERGLRLLLPHVAALIKAKDGADGKRIAVVVDENGNPRLTNRAGSHDPMTVEELVESFKKDHKDQFAGSGATGSGAPGMGSGGQGGSPTKIDPSLSPVEQLKAARRQGAAKTS